MTIQNVLESILAEINVSILFYENGSIARRVNNPDKLEPEWNDIRVDFIDLEGDTILLEVYQ